MLAGTRPSSAVIKPLHAGFAGWINAKQRRLGPVFADRHRSLTFDGDTAAALLAYIHNNPVRAGVVTDPADSGWTSHRAYLGLEPAPPWLDVERGLDLCGFSATPSGRLRFHEMVMARAFDARRIDLSGGDMQKRRRASRVEAGAPLEIGTPVVSSDEGVLRVVAPIDPDRACTRPPAWRGEPVEALQLVARAAETSLVELRSRSRVRRVTRARRLALLVWTRELQRSAAELTRTLVISSSSAAELIAGASSADVATASMLATELRAAAAGETEKPRTVP
jgi:hypothetical protein